MARKKIPLSDLEPSDYNPRKIAPEHMARLKTLIREHSGAVEGWDVKDGLRLATTITVNRQGMRIVGGHQRVKALLELGQSWIDSADITWVDLVPNSPQEKALNIALNSQDAAGEWDVEALSVLIGEIQLSDIDVEFTGLADDTIAELLASLKPPGPGPGGGGDDPPPDPAEKLREKWKTNVGDVWGLGAFTACPKCGKVHELS